MTEPLFIRKCFAPALPGACLAIGMLVTQTGAFAQSLEIKRYNPSAWTKGRFTEIVTVTGPGENNLSRGRRCGRRDGASGTKCPGPSSWQSV